MQCNLCKGIGTTKRTARDKHLFDFVEVTETCWLCGGRTWYPNVVNNRWYPWSQVLGVTQYYHIRCNHCGHVHKWWVNNSSTEGKPLSCSNCYRSFD